MKILPKSLLFTLLLLLMVCPRATAGHVVPGQWLIRLKKDVTPDSLTMRLRTQFYGLNTRSETENGHPLLAHGIPLTMQPVAGTLNIWLLNTGVENPEMLSWLLSQPEVLLAQENHYLSLRSTLLPDDPLYPQQWQYNNDGANGGLPDADLDAEDAWSISTGGLTVAGDTIVIAVIDGGVQKSHPDLKANLWKNRAETSGDGIDNDANGYVDDYCGWNVFSQNDQIQGFTTLHGTPVSGIIGASGNNGEGVTGVNWHVKMMFIAGGNLESELLSAYEYVLQARRRYNQTNGAAGAFVVAVNCSWGLDYGMPADAPLWCAAFDELGEEGVLSVAATANLPINVDLVGDLPTTCPSDYLISVTSLNKQDVQAPLSAWGPVSIDLGAYGEGVFTTSAGNTYGTHSGTSFAAPQVSGAIGLLYSASCPELITLAKTNPDSAAKWVKTRILNSVTPNLSLQNQTVTGGRLNLYTLLQEYEDQCATCPPPFAPHVQNISPYSALLTWSEISAFQAVRLRWREVGAANWTLIDNPGNPFQLLGLSPCSQYEFSLQSTCYSGENSDWSPVVAFVTLGCCEAPNFNWLSIPATTGVTYAWTRLDDFFEYRILIHESGMPEWHTYNTFDTLLAIPDLKACTSYEMLIQGWCLDTWISLSTLFTFQSPGCGSCLDATYCVSGATAAEEEWIKTVQVGTWQHHSGWGGGGYQNLTGVQASNPAITTLSAVDVTLTPGFWGTPYKEYFRIYVDFNLDGDFDDAGELAFDPGFAQEGIVVGSLVSPAFTQTGTTRMRVMMKYAENAPLPPGPCELYNYGQVEDYCIDLVDQQTDAKISFDSCLVLKIYPQPATNSVRIDMLHNRTIPVDLKVWDLSGRRMPDQSLSPMRHTGSVYLDINPWPSGIYFVAAESEGKVYWGKIIKQ